MISIEIHKKLAAPSGPMNLELSMELAEGSLTTLYGESGAGKTSTLRMLAGLMNPDQGKIITHNKVWYDSEKNINLTPQKRSIGYVFQDYALFPNMTVKENLRFAAKDKNDLSLIHQAIEIVELGDLQNRKPDTLSGGQQQRVALARSLVQKPEILLLDEPLSALDFKIRQKLQDYILKIHAEYGLTTLLISHDLGEIIKLSDSVYVLDKGKIIKNGKPTEVFIDQKISGKFQFHGEVIKVEAQQIIHVITVLIQNKLVKVIADKTEAQELQPGDKVMVATKAFNPIIYKIN